MAASSSQHPLFEVVLRQLPKVLGNGLRAAGMADPAILESYPCESYKELVDAGSLMMGQGGTVVLALRVPAWRPAGRYSPRTSPNLT